MIVDDIKHNVDIKSLSDNILKNLRPRDKRAIQELIDDDFIPLDDRTQQELEDNDYISLESENDDRVTIEDVFEPTPLYKIRPPKPDPIATDDIFNPPNNIGTTLPPSNFKKPEPNIVTVKDTVVPPLVNTIPPTAPPKTLDVDINALSGNILRNLRPKDDRNLQNLIDDDFIPLDHRIQAELEDDDYKSLPGDASPMINIDVTNAWDENKTTISKPRPIYKISTEYDRKLKVANKIKNKYLRTKIGTRKTQNKISAEWLKKAGFLDTKDQDKINYIFVPPKKEEKNKIPGDAGHFIRKEIDNTDFKNENLISKEIRNKNVRKPYLKTKKDKGSTNESIKVLEDIAVLEPGKNAQIAAKEINEKYKKKSKLPGEIAVGDVIETTDGEKIKIIAPRSNISSLRASKKIKEKYRNLRKNKIMSKKIVESNKKNKILKDIDTIEKVKTASEKKRDRALAQKIVKKYRNLKKPKKTYLVEEKDIETIDYTEPQEDIFAGESILNAANKVLNFKQFKKEQEKLLKKSKKGKAIAAKNVLKKYKNMKKPKKTYLVNENDLETIDYSKP